MNKRTKITLTATPKEGYRFVSWSNGITDNPYATTVGNIIGQENRIEPVYSLENSSEPIIDCAYNEIRYINNTKIILNYTNDYYFYSSIISHSFNEITHEGIITFSRDITAIPDNFISKNNSIIEKVIFPECTNIIGLIPTKINVLKATNQNLRFIHTTADNKIFDIINCKSPYIKSMLAVNLWPPTVTPRPAEDYIFVLDGGFGSNNVNLCFDAVIYANSIICNENVINFWKQQELAQLNELKTYYISHPNANYNNKISQLESSANNYNEYTNWQVNIINE